MIFNIINNILNNNTYPFVPLQQIVIIDNNYPFVPLQQIIISN